MRSFLVLLNLSFKSMLYAVQASGGKKKAFSGIGVMILIGAVLLYVSGTYSFLFATQLRKVDMLPLLIMMMGVLSVAAGFFFTVFSAQGVLFGGRDNDLLFSMPISAFTLLLARISALYLENLLFSLFVMLPAGVAYLLVGGDGGAGFFVGLLLGTVLLTLLPTFLALLAGFVLGWISARFARRNFVSMLLYGLLLAVILILSFRASFLMNSLAAEAAGVATAFQTWGLPFVLLAEASCDESLLSLFLLASLCIGPFLLTVVCFAVRYKALTTQLQSHASGRVWKSGPARATSPMRTLLKKEASRFFGSPVYLFNTGLGLLFLLVSGCGVLVKRDMVQSFLSDMTGFMGTSPLPILIAGLCMFLSTVTITAVSISLEGKQLWILKSCPVDHRTLFGVKTGFQLLLTVPCILFSVTAFTIAFGMGILEGLLLFLFGMGMAAFTAPFGLIVNLYLPKLDAVNESMAVKQSASVVISLFFPIILSCFGIGLWLWIGSAFGEVVALLICLCLLFLCAVIAWLALMKLGPRRYALL